MIKVDINNSDEILAKVRNELKEFQVTLPSFNGVHNMVNYANFLRCSASQRCSNCTGLI